MIILLTLTCLGYSLTAQPCTPPQPIIRYDVPTSLYGFQNVELRIYNQTKYYNRETPGDIRVLIIPIGAFFNAEHLYTPKAASIISHTISGKEIIIPVQSNSSTPSFLDGNWDRSSGNSDESQFSYGYGKYSFVFYRWEDGEWVYSNYINIDFRDAALFPAIPNVSGSLTDMRIDYFTKDTITYQFDARHDTDNADYKYKFWHINLVNKELKVWDKYGTCIPPWVPDTDTFYVDASNNEYLKWPINANRYNGNIGFENPGDLGMNIVINHNVTTQDTALGNGNIYIPEYGFLKIASDKTFNMKKPKSGFHNLVVQDSSLLWLDAGSLLIVDTLNRLTLKPNGTIKLGHNSEIVFEPGSLFCNEGGAILIHELSDGSGFGRITFKNGYLQFNCAQLLDFVFGDSIKLVLPDSAILEIPDSTTLHFTGNESGLIMKPNSKLKMGVGSKILFENSAKLIADSAEVKDVKDINGIVYKEVAYINQGFCQGCGTCTATCLSKSIELSGFNNEEIFAEIAAL